jgi:hypothetical protein
MSLRETVEKLDHILGVLLFHLNEDKDGNFVMLKDCKPFIEEAQVLHSTDHFPDPPEPLRDTAIKIAMRHHFSGISGKELKTYSYLSELDTDDQEEYFWKQTLEEGVFVLEPFEGRTIAEVLGMVDDLADDILKEFGHGI